MTDVTVYMTDDNQLDLDIIDGFPALVLNEDQNEDQRAAIATYICIGTIPGMRSVGIDWESYYSQKSSAIDISNQAQQMINNYAGSATHPYTPYLYQTSEGATIVTTRT